MSSPSEVYATTEVFGALVAMACEQSPEFHEKFVRDPRGMLNKCLEQHGGKVHIADDMDIVVHENSADVLNVAVPAYHGQGTNTLSDEQLEQIAAGEFVFSALAAILIPLGTVGAATATVIAGTSASIGAGTAVALGAATIAGIGLGAAGITTAVVVSSLAGTGNL